MYDYYITALNLPGRERLDPLLDVLQQLGLESAVPYVQLLVIFIGASWFFSLTALSRFRSLSAGVVFLLSVLLLLGTDPVALRWHWFPTIAAIQLSVLRSSRVFLTFLFFSSVALFIYTAGSLAPLGILFLFLLYCLHPKESANESETSKPAFFTAGILFALALSVLTLPSYPMLEYPGEARLAPISALLLSGRPMVGPFLEPLPMLETGYQAVLCATFLLSAAMLMLFYLGLRLDPQRELREFAARFLCCGALLLFILFAELLPLVDLQKALPFPVLTRLLPGLALSPLPWLLLPFFLLFALSFWGRIELRTQVLSSGVLVLALVLSASCRSFTLPSSLEVSVAEVKNARSDLTKWGASSFLLRKRGEWAKTPRSFESMTRLKSGEDFQLSVQAEPNAKDASQAIDGDVSTRWRTARPQRRGDYFTMDFAEAVPLARVVLSVQGVPSDYPRALSITAKLDDGTEAKIFHEDDWLGPVKWTSEGLPYFGPQSEVIFDFPQELRVQSLRFELLIDEEVFDWAITEVKLYRMPKLVVLEHRKITKAL